jgi:CubicO group peptidase (beta-lactamase class C family)
MKLGAVVMASALVGCHEPVDGVGAVDDPHFRSVLSLIESDLRAHDVPGASIAIVENGHWVAAAGIAHKQRSGAEGVTPRSRFRVASLSKMVLAAAALQLVEEGKLDLTRPVTDYVPFELASGFDPASVELQHLLTHTSGIPDVSIGFSCPVGKGENAAWFAMNNDLPLWAPPGEVWNYSNRGFSLAGWVIETLSGERYEDAIAERVFGPAGMSTATYDPVAARAGDHAVGHDSSTEIEPDSYDCAATRPPDGVLATPTDYAHFAEMLLAGGGAAAALTSGHVDTDELPDGNEQYGFGMFVVSDYKGYKLWMHDGEAPGYRSTIWIVPDQQFAVILFYNSTVRAPSHVAARAVDEYLSLGQVAGPSGATPPNTWTKYTGTYDDPYALGEVQVWLDDDELHASAPKLGLTDQRLTQVAGDNFSTTLGEVIFRPGPDGHVRWLVTRKGVAVLK